jgi:hypothetical protein
MATRDNAILSVLFKPLVVELGAVVLCQAVGLPLLSKLGVLLRRFRGSLWCSHRVAAASRGLGALLLRRIPPAARRVAARQARVVSVGTGRAWKAFGNVYKQTSLSKIVNRSKKLMKVFVAHHHEHPDEEERGPKLTG